MTFTSYAQNFEDIMLHRALKHVRGGVYVDVGAQHPVIDSVTKAFSNMGWHGANIEPIPAWFHMLEADRPRDLNFDVAIGATGEAIIFDVEGTGLSTTDAGLAARYVAEGRAVQERRVRSMRLDDIFAALGADDIHFLKVDCEGAERVALESCSFDAVRPWIVVVEATEPNSQVSTAGQWEGWLTDHGYLRAYDDGLNLYFVAGERSTLLDAFVTPPNVFDDFVLARGETVAAQMAELELRAHKLGVELRGSRASADDVSRRLVAEQKLKFEALAKLAEVHRDMQGRIDSLASELSRRDEVIAAMLRSTSWRVSAPVRLLKKCVKRGVRIVWRLARPAVTPAARALRPLIRASLQNPRIRSGARSLFGPETRIGRRARTFVLGQVSGVRKEAAPLAMTESAEAMERMLRVAISKRTHG
jgi:FkbM family methyltransferase